MVEEYQINLQLECAMEQVDDAFDRFFKGCENDLSRNLKSKRHSEAKLFNQGNQWKYRFRYGKRTSETP